MRNISFSMTEPQLLDLSKSVTRRRGWWNLKPGDKLCAVRKAMGLKKGEKVHRFGEVEVLSANPQPLRLLLDSSAWALDELEKEGFPELSPAEFVDMFCASHACTADDQVMRIEFKFTPIG